MLTAPCSSLVLYGKIAEKALFSSPAAPSEDDNSTRGTSAVFTIGWMYYFGMRGCPVNKKKAYAYFYAAAERGDALAQYYMGLQLLAGDGTKQDSEAGLSSLLRAAEAGGLDVAMYTAAKLLLAGSDDAGQHDKAARLLEAAAAQGNVPAINKLAELRTRPAVQGSS
jgi:TPR repeat protein